MEIDSKDRFRSPITNFGRFRRHERRSRGRTTKPRVSKTIIHRKNYEKAMNQTRTDKPSLCETLSLANRYRFRRNANVAIVILYTVYVKKKKTKKQNKRRTWDTSNQKTTAGRRKTRVARVVNFRVGRRLSRTITDVRTALGRRLYTIITRLQKRKRTVPDEKSYLFSRSFVFSISVVRTCRAWRTEDEYRTKSNNARRRKTFRKKKIRIVFNRERVTDTFGNSNR